jgi:serine/threonine-protein kinase RsbW
MPLLKNGHYSIQFESSIENLEKVEAVTAQISEELLFPESDVDDISISITELFNNAIHHGNQNNLSKMIYVTYDTTPAAFRVSVKDEGQGFSVTDLKDPLAPENLLAESGRGIYLVKELMDKVEIKTSSSGTEIIIHKNLPGK